MPDADRAEANGTAHAFACGAVAAALRRPVSSTASGSLSAIVIEVVSEKTGYPADVLDLDMQLDADLGIDSIKRVEILSALQDRLPSLPSISPELLGTLRTLRSIVEHIGGAHPPSGHDCRSGSGRRATRRSRCVSGDRSRAARDGRRQDGLSRRDARARHAAGCRPRHRFDQAGRDLLGHSGSAARRPRRRARGDRHARHPARNRRVSWAGPSAADPEPESRPASDDGSELAGGSAIARVLLESVAEKTGFPIDMLELDMQLDVDLGIDSIKRVEIFSAVQDRLPMRERSAPSRSGRCAPCGRSPSSCRVRSGARSDRGSRESGNDRGRRRGACPSSLRTLYPQAASCSSCPIVAMTSRCERAGRCGSPTMARRWPRPSSAG